jgi:hypothetical protein
MYKSPSASALVPNPKRYFDPVNEEDLREFMFYINNGTWRDCCPFMIEWPRVSIPDMIKDRILSAHLGKIIDNVQNKKEKN